MSEPEEIIAARGVLRQYQRAQDAERKAKEERQRLEWVAACVGRRFEVDVDGVEPYGSDRHAVRFTARLVDADRNEGTMTWDNGVVTEGLWILPGDALPEPVSTVTASQEDVK